MNQQDVLAQAYFHFQHGKFDAAHALLQPLTQVPGADANVLHLAAAVAAALGLHSEAITLFQAALERATGEAALRVAIAYKLARVLVDAGRPQEALSLYLQLLVEGVEHIDIYRAAAMLLYQFERHQEALQVLEKALQLAPQMPDSWHLQAMVQARLRLMPQAAASLQQACRLAPQEALYAQELALALYGLHRYDEALQVVQQALRLQPGHGPSWNTRASIESRLGLYDESIASSERALALQPGEPNASQNLALTLLAVGQMERAWPLYELRWQGDLADPLRHQQWPRWDGIQPLLGKTILLWFEQGFGDAMQFCRYALQVARSGARIVLEMPRPLVGLMQTLALHEQAASAAAIMVIEQGAEAALADAQIDYPIDYQLPLMSLPGIFATTMETIPAPRAYLRADPRKAADWAEVLGSPERLRIGIVASGNPGNAKDVLRSIPLQKFAPLLDSIDADFYLLQPDLRQADFSYLQQQPVLQWPGKHLHGFDDTAALIANLDLVISVDTAVSHLSGALHAPVWILLTHAADWRWFRMRQDCPWYPSARLFRQRRHGDWGEVIGQVMQALLGPLSAETTG